MNRLTGPSVATQSSIALMAAATSWTALLSWRGFTELPGRFLGPAFLLAFAVAAIGVAARAWRMPNVLVVLAQLLGGGLLVGLLLGGSLLPPGAALTAAGQALARAWSSASWYAAPVPSDVPGVEPLLMLGVLLLMVLVDLCACTWRRPALVGLPLLITFSIPISLIGGGVSWWVFALTAACFLSLLFLHEGVEIAQFGQALGHYPGVTARSASDVGPGAVRASASTIGAVATTLAIFLPALIPTLHLGLIGHNGSEGGSQISIVNPMTDLKRDLVQGPDVALLRLTTDDPQPQYLRISVLNRFSENAWSSGDRSVPRDQQADGPLPNLVGVSTSVPRTEYEYQVTAAPNFSSTWLPTQAPVSEVTAAGDWRYDASTMDFLASDPSLTTSGLQYSMTAVQLDLTAQRLSVLGDASGLVGKQYTSLPADLPPMVTQYAQDVTRDAETRFARAVALQDWFRRDGGFRYDTSVAPGTGTDDLVAFLSEAGGGRVGYCEQFASAMAVMARAVGIPARVAVGFLQPDLVGPGTWEYSSHDLHAWPELFFPGSGWVRFEPTPSARSGPAPDYTRQQAVGPGPAISPDQGATSNGAPGRRGTREDEPSASPSRPSSTSASWRDHLGVTLGGVLGVGAFVLLALLPRTVRRRRRAARLDADLESAWHELRDTAVDLGLEWPTGRSPRETRDRLVPFLGAGQEASNRAGAVGEHGAVLALDRLVAGLEQQRYARDHGAGASAVEETRVCLAALYDRADARTRRRAEWWPRSVVRGLRPARKAASAPVETRYGGVVDQID